MIEVVVVGEGQTEETFVRDVLAPAFGVRSIFLEPRLISTSKGAKGGALSRDRVLRFMRNTLRERSDTYVTTFFDLYRLSVDFVAAAVSAEDPLARCTSIERNFAAAVVNESGCRADRFIPHIQPYEFEALLFSDSAQFARTRSEWARFVEQLQRVRDEAMSPEHINDGPETHPSARLERILRPRYDKPLHGSAVAQCIGLQRIRSECRHFHEWLTRIETLHPLA